MTSKWDMKIWWVLILTCSLCFQESLLGDCTKAKTKLGWKTKYDFDVSINAAIIENFNF